MTRITNTGATGPQQIPSQDAAPQQVSKTQTQKTQEPSSTEQQQGKQAAQGRKSDIDLQGTIKQSQLAMFHGPGSGGNRDQTVQKTAAVEKMPKAEDISEDYPIVPSSKNQLHESVKTVVEGSWPNYTVQYPTKGYREANSAGLEQRLKDLNNGQPLTDFEKGWVAKWDKESIGTDFTPILIVGEKGVQAYKVTQGGGSSREINYYDREGNKLAGPLYPSEAGLPSEGLGAIDLLLGGLLVKKLGGIAISRVRGWAAAQAEEAAAAAAARTEGDAIANGTGKAVQQGSGTSIYIKPPKGGFPEPPPGEFTAAEEKEIYRLQDEGLTRPQAEWVVRESKLNPELGDAGINARGTTRLPDYKTPGAGKHRP
jgi:hypothetical protein